MINNKTNNPTIRLLLILCFISTNSYAFWSNSLEDAYEKWTATASGYARSGFAGCDLRIRLTFITPQILNEWSSNTSDREVRKRVKILSSTLNTKNISAYLLVVDPMSDNFPSCVVHIKNKKSFKLFKTTENIEYSSPKYVTGNIFGPHEMRQPFYGLVVFESAEIDEFTTSVIRMNFDFTDTDAIVPHSLEFPFLPNGAQNKIKHYEKDKIDVDTILTILSMAFDIIKILK
jgi:hypothetical protein